MPVITDMMAQINTACSGGSICNQKPSANKAVPNPASPLINPPAIAPAVNRMRL
jgi:hypothetical protein